MIKNIVLFLALLAVLTSCEDKYSSGTVRSKIQTIGMDHSPTFYLYIIDSVDHHIYEYLVNADTYFKIKEGDKLRYKMTFSGPSIY